MEGPGNGQIVPVEGTQWTTPQKKRKLSPQQQAQQKAQQALVDRSSQAKLRRQLVKNQDSEEGIAGLSPDGQEWVNSGNLGELGTLGVYFE